MEKAINVPLARCISDLDPSKHEPSDFTFPTMNMRIINYVGKGFVCSNIAGNSKDSTANGELFEVSNSTCLGGIGYNGILYVLSVKDSGEGEIGCFPSPKTWDKDEDEFEDVYKPLKVWNDGASVTDLITSDLKFSIENNYDVVIKQEFDDTLSLYISDYVNPSIVINTGFAQNGNYKPDGHILNSEKLKGSAQLIQGSRRPMKTTLNNIKNVGNNKPGTYHIYIAYQDKYYNRTRFYSVCYPVQIIKNTTFNSVQGFRDLNEDGYQQNARKTIVLSLTGVDMSYDYLYVVVSRYSASEDEYAIEDLYAVDKRYKITGNTMQIEITGFEGKAALSKTELYNSLNYTINRSQVVYKKRYWAGNWKSLNYNREALAEYASLITIKPVFKEIGDEKLEHYIDSGGSFMQYQDAKKVYDYTSLARGEIYPYAVQFLLKDGTITKEVYPVRGVDMLNLSLVGGVYGNINQESAPYTGLVRMPGYGIHVNYEPKVNEQKYVLGLEFNTTASSNYADSNSDLFENVIGFRFVKAERNQNLLYQGFIYNTTNRVGNIPNTAGATDNKMWLVGDTESGSYRFPIFGKNDGSDKMVKSFPGAHMKNPDGDPKEWKYHAYDCHIDKQHFACFSPEFIFELNSKLSEGQTVFVKPVLNLDKNVFEPVGIASMGYDYYNGLNDGFGGTGKDSFYGYNDSATYAKSMLCRSFYNPNWFGVHASGENNNVEPSMLSGVNMKAYNVYKGMHKGPGGFSSWIGDGSKTGDKGFFGEYDDGGDHHEYYNRSNQAASYIGLESQDGDVDLEFCFVNIYLEENNILYYNVAKSRYNPENNYYKPITDFNINLSSRGVNTFEVFKGDTFLQRTAIRTNRWYGVDDNNDEDLWGIVNIDPDVVFNDSEYPDPYSVMYQHGFLLSIMTENFVNTQARQNTIGTEAGTNNMVEYSFWPNVLDSDFRKDTMNFIVEGVALEDMYEAIQLNDGYNKIFPDAYYPGYDDSFLNYLMEYLTRIHFSNPQVNEEISDSFRQIFSGSYKDYLNKGGIMRLFEIFGKLYSVQKNSIEEHYVDEKQLMKEDNNNRIVAGRTEFLSTYSRVLADYGIHHYTAATKSAFGVYGVYWMRSAQKLWKLQYSEGGARVVELGKQKLIRTEFEKYIKKVQNANVKFEDKPTKGNGIVVWRDRKYMEVNFTFLNKEVLLSEFEILNDNLDWFDKTTYNKASIVVHNNTLYYSLIDSNYNNEPASGSMYWTSFDQSDFTLYDPQTSYPAFSVIYDCSKNKAVVLANAYSPGTQRTVDDIDEFFNQNPTNHLHINCFDGGYSKTFVFDENLDYYKGTNQLYPSMVIENGDYVNSSKAYDYQLRGSIYQHNLKDQKYLRFYNKSHEMKISFYVNAHSVNMTAFDKMFESLELKSTQLGITKIEFETNHQYSYIDIATAEYWEKPEYKLNHWFIPIPDNKDVAEEQFGTDSEMMGTWLKVTISFSSDNLIHLKEIITNFNVKEV